MVSIGWRNLKRDPIRLMVAVFGVVFAVVLLTVEVGMLLGLVRNASLLIDNSKADIWVSTKGVKTFDFATPIPKRLRILLESVDGVDKVEEYNVSYSIWKLPDGSNSNCQVAGFDIKGELHPELNLVEGRIEDLHNQDAVIIDKGERRKLGWPKIGDYVEILSRRAKIVGFTEDMTSFTTTPYVFTSLRRAQKYGWLTIGVDGTSGAQAAVYFLIKVKPGYDVSAVCNAIQTEMPELEANSRQSFSWRTQKYWLIETGVGAGFIVAAFLGLLVGGVIVSQILYAMTVEKLPEFGLLKAMGSNMREIGRIVLEQGMICGVLGLLVGMGISVVIGIAATKAGTAVLIPPGLMVLVGVVTLSLCALSSLVSIAKLRNLEPATVFRT